MKSHSLTSATTSSPPPVSDGAEARPRLADAGCQARSSARSKPSPETSSRISFCSRTTSNRIAPTWARLPADGHSHREESPPGYESTTCSSPCHLKITWCSTDGLSWMESACPDFSAPDARTLEPSSARRPNDSSARGSPFARISLSGDRANRGHSPGTTWASDVCQSFLPDSVKRATAAVVAARNVPSGIECTFAGPPMLPRLRAVPDWLTSVSPPDIEPTMVLPSESGAALVKRATGNGVSLPV